MLRYQLEANRALKRFTPVASKTLTPVVLRDAIGLGRSAGRASASGHQPRMAVPGGTVSTRLGETAVVRRPGWPMSAVSERAEGVEGVVPASSSRSRLLEGHVSSDRFKAQQTCLEMSGPTSRAIHPEPPGGRSKSGIYRGEKCP